MKRRHVFEFNDLSWWPDSLRALLTDYLSFCFRISRPFAPRYDLIVEAMEATQTNSVVDLGSGAAGPWQELLEDLRQTALKPVLAVLTDKFPHPEAVKRLSGRNGLTYWPKPVDARAVPPELNGVRTLFDLLHHFRPEQARAILADAVQQNQAIIVFENLYRSWFHFVGAMFVPFSVLLTTVWIKPRSWRRLLFTYVIPIAPLVIAWDGAVSVLRCYRPRELEAMGREVAGDRYVWKAGAYHKGVMPVTYLVGYPKPRAETDDQSGRYADATKPGRNPS